MAGGGNVFTAIDILALSCVRGGVDKQTRAAQLVLQQATSAIEDLAKSMVPKNAGMMQVMMQVLGRRRRPGPGPTPAPALPPTSTLTR